ncbi:hypothetical protein KIW84_034966 [Lathyrus oleraceus]|uniref:Uncharacterized protein n=1 Tax=Pisum sativum TaxID=3888 RepID=A0A9D4Y0S9_PEA|nr:hypothetical protein KIW84_034966 [Pisum sativum]
MLELSNLMDTPIEEQQKFQNVTCNIAASEHKITEPNTLSAVGDIENMLMHYVPEVKGVEQEMDVEDEEAELSGQVE